MVRVRKPRLKVSWDGGSRWTRRACQLLADSPVAASPGTTVWAAGNGGRDSGARDTAAAGRQAVSAAGADSQSLARHLHSWGQCVNPARGCAEHPPMALLAALWPADDLPNSKEVEPPGKSSPLPASTSPSLPIEAYEASAFIDFAFRGRWSLAAGAGASEATLDTTSSLERQSAMAATRCQTWQGEWQPASAGRALRGRSAFQKSHRQAHHPPPLRSRAQAQVRTRCRDHTCGPDPPAR